MNGSRIWRRKWRGHRRVTKSSLLGVGKKFDLSATLWRYPDRWSRECLQRSQPRSAKNLFPRKILLEGTRTPKILIVSSDCLLFFFKLYVDRRWDGHSDLNGGDIRHLPLIPMNSVRSLNRKHHFMARIIACTRIGLIPSSYMAEIRQQMLWQTNFASTSLPIATSVLDRTLSPCFALTMLKVLSTFDRWW